MTKYLILLVFCFSFNAFGEKELLSDKARIKFSRTNISTLSDGSVQATYETGLDGKNRLLAKIKDLADLDNLEYLVEESNSNNPPLTLKITFKNGLLVDKALKSLPDRLP